MQATFYGCQGTTLTADEIAFYKDADPLGFILFKRNCESKAQLRRLTDSLRELTGREQLMILIDQEGGRVTRMAPPEWEAIPDARHFVESDDPETACYEQGRLIASQLRESGLTVNCTPLGDIPVPGSHDIIGNRAFGTTAEQVTTLARQHAKGLLDGGILPVLKHIPGHGRAVVDSHEELPIVDTPLEELEATDFAPFRNLADLPLGMTAHIIYPALDDMEVATFSAPVIRMIREKIGFDGLLMSDDLSMKALSGSYAQRAEKALAAGCDAVLHCNGEMPQMIEVAQGASPLTPQALTRIEKAWEYLEPSIKQ